MNDLLPFLIVCMATFIVGWFLPLWIARFITYREKQKFLKSVTATPVEETKLCSGAHEWISLRTLQPDGRVINANVCKTCGFIPSSNTMASKTSLDNAKENIKEEEEMNKVINEFSVLEEGQLKELFADELKNGMDFQKVLKAYNAGQTLKPRFIMYRLKQFESNKTDGKGQA